MTSIPRAIPAGSVRQLSPPLIGVTAMGRRDYAILLLLARLGLRSSEVAFLELEDIDWNAGQCERSEEKAVTGAHSRYPRTSAKRSPRICGTDDPAAPVAAYFCGPKRPIRGFHGPAAIDRSCDIARARRHQGTHYRRASVSPWLGD